MLSLTLFASEPKKLDYIAVEYVEIGIVLKYRLWRNLPSRTIGVIRDAIEVLSLLDYHENCGTPLGILHHCSIPTGVIAIGRIFKATMQDDELLDTD